MQTARASLEQSSEQIRALLEARDTDTLTGLVTSFAMLPPEKFTAYANAVYAIAHETGVDIGALVERQIARSNEQLSEAVETLAKERPGRRRRRFRLISKSMEAARAATSRCTGSGAGHRSAAEALVVGLVGGVAHEPVERRRVGHRGCGSQRARPACRAGSCAPAPHLLAGSVAGNRVDLVDPIGHVPRRAGVAQALADCARPAHRRAPRPRAASRTAA